MSKYETHADLARLCAALGHPVRLKLFTAIRDHCCLAEGQRGQVGSCHVGDLYDQVDVAPSTVSHHLARLKEAGLVKERRAGTFLYLTIGDDALAAIARLLTFPAAVPACGPPPDRSGS